VFFYYTILKPMDRLAGFYHKLYEILGNKLDTDKKGGGVFSELNRNRFYVAMFAGLTYWLAFGKDGASGQGKIQGLANKAGAGLSKLGGGGLTNRKDAGKGRKIPGSVSTTVQGTISGGDTRKRRAQFTQSTSDSDGNTTNNGGGNGAGRGGSGAGSNGAGRGGSNRGGRNGNGAEGPINSRRASEIEYEES
jgi:hypothetical protein